MHFGLTAFTWAFQLGPKRQKIKKNKSHTHIVHQQWCNVTTCIYSSAVLSLNHLCCLHFLYSCHLLLLLQCNQRGMQYFPFYTTFTFTALVTILNKNMTYKVRCQVPNSLCKELKSRKIENLKNCQATILMVPAS